MLPSSARSQPRLGRRRTNEVVRRPSADWRLANGWTPRLPNLGHMSRAPFAMAGPGHSGAGSRGEASRASRAQERRASPERQHSTATGLRLRPCWRNWLSPEMRAATLDPLIATTPPRELSTQGANQAMPARASLSRNADARAASSSVLTRARCVPLPSRPSSRAAMVLATRSRAAWPAIAKCSAEDGLGPPVPPGAIGWDTRSPAVRSDRRSRSVDPGLRPSADAIEVELQVPCSAASCAIRASLGRRIRRSKGCDGSSVRGICKFAFCNQSANDA
jgi:hypothetical protein